jgi:hypothetical protein
MYYQIVFDNNYLYHYIVIIIVCQTLIVSPVYNSPCRTYTKRQNQPLPSVLPYQIAYTKSSLMGVNMSNSTPAL